MVEVPKSYRYWFYAATVYNTLWGLAVIAFPSQFLDLLGVAHLVSPPFLQVLGMMVGVYAYGYWLLAKDPIRYSGFIWIGLFGKVFGVAGLLFYASRGTLPWSLGLTILPNDAVWLPAFIAFAWKYARNPV